jgi:hypothetical protein
MVSVNLELSWTVKGGIATAAIGVMQQLPQGIAGAATLETTDKPKANATARAKKKSSVNDQIEYSEEFETKVWQPYPRREGSKKKAYDYWNMLNDENRARVLAAIPLFVAQMKREGRPPEKIPHLTTWFNGRDYETVAPSIVPAKDGGPAKPFWETATRQDWISALLQWSMNWNWKKIWGPEPENPLRPNPPGAPKHHVPQDILDRFDLKYRGHLYSDEERAAIKARVEAAEASKHAVDKDRVA